MPFRNAETTQSDSADTQSDAAASDSTDTSADTTTGSADTAQSADTTAASSLKAIIPSVLDTDNGIRLGLDLVGGSRIVYEAEIPDGYNQANLADDMNSVQKVIRQRLTDKGFTEATVALSGENRVTVEIPQITNPEEAVQTLGTTAQLTFIDADGKEWLTGSDIKKATYGYGRPTGNEVTDVHYVQVQFTSEGQKKFAEATGNIAARTDGTNIMAIVMDNQVISSPSVSSQIDSDSCVISGSFTRDSASELADLINAGQIPFSLKQVELRSVGPQLGADAMRTSLIAGLIGIALVMLFMLIVYRIPGLVASIALCFYMVIEALIFSLVRVNLSLPGIAGIILAIGMGVDANVITAERIKEELNNGKSLDGALKSGFARGLTPIIDGNVTIVIVAIVLMGAFGPSDGLFAKALHFVFFAFGPSTAGTIYAFGYTLLTGVLLNFVFGVFATRVMIRGAASIKALRNPWLYGAVKPGKEVKEKKPIDFVGLRKRFLTISTCLMAAIILCAAVFGVRLDTEFTGGAMITLSYQGEISTSEVQKTASTALENNGLTLQTGENVATGEQTLKISMPGNETVTTDQVENLLTSLNEQYPDNAFAQLSLSNVSAAMGTKFLQKSLVAVVFSLLLILLYIGFRFKKIGGMTGGLMAVLALLNDLMVVFGTFVLLRTPLDGNFIAAMLTILGYSINDTVVVYDRIRENRALMGKKTPFEELVNHSVNQSARRTIITTVTTVMALGVMCVVSKLYGLDSIFTFAFPLMMGMLSGVYTSLCVSTSAWVLWNDRKSKKAETKKA